jgi:CO/xanthine dehydrogenase FAD-binding subunit
MGESLTVLVPSSPEDAVRLFGDGSGVTVIGGGTIVIPSLALGRRSAERAMLLHRAGMNGARRDGARITLGATTTLDELGDLPDPLRTAVAHVADGEIRGQATIGGNICAEVADAPRGDLQGALIALGAQVRSTGAGGERTEAIENFLPGRRDRLVLDISFDEPAAGAYEFLDRPHTHDYTALAVSAARAADGTIRLGVTGVGPHGLLLASPDDTDDLPFADDALASAWYRRRTLPVLVRRVLTKLGEPA